MLRLPNNLLLLYPFLTSSAVSAWIYTPSQGFGPAPEDHAALFLQANQNPNATASAPFQLSGQLYNLTVNVTELTPTGADTNITNPRVISTVYSLEWPGDSSLNATLEEAQGGVPRLCATIPSSPFSASITNGYIDAGDCSGALGEDCVNALEASSYESSAGCSRPLQADDECRSKWPNGGLATSSLTQGFLNMTNRGFYWRTSAIYSAGNDTLFNSETERLQMAVISGLKSSPVCLRISDNHVSPSDPSTSTASPSWKSAWPFWTAIIACVLSLL